MRTLARILAVFCLACLVLTGCVLGGSPTPTPAVVRATPTHINIGPKATSTPRATITATTTATPRAPLPKQTVPKPVVTVPKPVATVPKPIATAPKPVATLPPPVPTP